MGSSSTSSSRRLFALKLAAFLALVAALDAAIGTLLRTYYFQQRSGLNYRTTYVMDDSTEEIIVLGSSRAQANIVPSVLEDITGRTCYNGGRDGQSLLYALAVQEAVLARYTPQAFVLDLNAADFYFHRRHYDRLAALLPYDADHPEIRPILRLRSRFESLKLASRIYPYNSLALQIARYNLRDVPEHKGHVPQHGRIALPLPRGAATPPRWIAGDLDPEMVRAFARFVANCDRSGARLHVIVSPIYDGDVFGRPAMAKVNEILAPTPYEIWDYADDPAFLLDTAVFRDRDHLNAAGAERFSHLVARRLSTAGS